MKTINKPSDDSDAKKTSKSNSALMQEYWKKNLTYLVVLLSIWFVSSFGAGIIFAEQLNNIKVGGFKLGFWFAQQGSMYIFVILIFVYVLLMNRLDKQYDVDEK
jgi:putative solute:sodium symporter small subunit